MQEETLGCPFDCVGDCRNCEHYYDEGDYYG